MKRATTDAKPLEPSSVVTGLDADDTLELVRLETEGPIHEDLVKGTNNMISDLNFDGTWDELIAKLEQTYPHLIDDDLSLTEGGELEWLTRLGWKLGETEEQIRAIIAKL